MNPFRHIRSFFRKPPGIPLGVQVPAESAEHAVDFSHRWADKLDHYAAVRMEELGIPSQRIGSSDHDHGIASFAFNPYERDGGGISTGGRINLDSVRTQSRFADREIRQESREAMGEFALPRPAGCPHRP